MSVRYDVVVIGGGHNGLAAAGLLAKRGRRVLVVEARDVFGGLAAGEEFHPGYRTAGVLHDTAGLRPWVVDELGLVKHGLVRRTSAVPVLVPERSGMGLVFCEDAHDLGGWSSTDGERYLAYRSFLARIVPILRRLLDRSPPDLLEPAMGDLLSLGGAAVALRLLGRRDMMEVLRVAPMCLADWLGEWFESEPLKAALAGPAVYSTYTGPRSPGGTANLLVREALFETPVRGGPQALAGALESAARDQGAEMLAGSAVEQILVDAQQVSGVKLRGGDIIEARTVAASCDPKQLFLKLVPAGELSRRLEWNVRNFRTRGTTAKVHLALRGYPKFSGREGQVHERIRTGESLNELERAFDAVKYRRFSERPTLDIWFPGVETPDLAPAGHHVASILVHCAPYDLEGGWNEETKESLYDAVLDVLSSYAPGIQALVVGREILSPADLEERYGLTQGHLHHGEHSIDQLIVRPSPECARYATPLRGLYLCGSGSHPGGGLTCAPGALAAKMIAGRRAF